MKSFKRKFENILKRSLALMLVLCMFLGCLAYAGENEPETPESTTTQKTPSSGDAKPSGGGDTVVTSDGTATGRIRVFIQTAKGKQEGTSSEVKLSEGEWRILGVYASNFYTPFLTNLTGENSVKENAEQALKALGSFDETQATNWAGSIAGLATESKNLNELKLYIRKKESKDSYKFKEIKGVPVNYYNYIHMMLGTITDLMISYNDFSLLTETPGEAYKECKDYKDKIPDLTSLEGMSIGIEKLDSSQLENFSKVYNSGLFPMYPNTFLGEKSIDYTGVLGYYQYLARRIGVTVPKTYYKQGDHYYSVSEYGVEPVDEGTDLDKLDTKISEDLLYYAELANTTNGDGMAYLGSSDSKICSNFYVNPQHEIRGTMKAEVKLSASQKVFLKCLELSDLNSGYGLSIFNIKKDKEGESIDLIKKLSENKLNIDESKVQGTIFGTKMACSCFGDIIIMSESENIVAIPACMNPFIWQPVDDKGKDIQGYAGGDGNYSSEEKKENMEGLGSYVNIINIPLISEYESKDNPLFSSNSFSISGKLSQGSFSFNKTKEALSNLGTDDTNEATQGSTQAYYDLRIAHGSGGEGDNDKAANVTPYSHFLLASSLYSAGAYKTESLDRQKNATLVSLWANATEMGNLGLTQSRGGAFDAVTLLNNDLNDRTSRHVDGLILSTDETISTASESSLSRVCVIHPGDFKNIDNRCFFANAAYLDPKAEAYFYGSDTLDSDNYKLVTFIPFVSSEDYKGTKYSPKKEDIGGYTSSFKDIVKDGSKSQVDRYKEYVKDTKGTTALMIYLTYLYAGYCGGCVEGYKEEQPDKTIGQLGYRLNFDNVSSMEDFNKDAAGDTTPSDDTKDQKDGMLDAIKGWLYYLLNPKEGLTYIRVWFTNKVGTIICSIHNAMLGTHGVGQTLGVTRYRSTTGFITMPDLSEMEWSSTLMDVLYSAIPYLIIAALILFVLMFATATLPFQKCILGFIIFCVVVCLPIPVTNTVVGWTNRTLSNMYGEKFTYWAMIQQESYLEDIDKAAQGDDYQNYLRTIYEKNSDTNPNQGSECVQVKWQAPKKMQSLMYTSADSKTTKNLFQNSLFTKALQNNYSGERFEDNDTAVYLYRSYLDIANASRYIYRGLFGTDGAFTKRTRALKPLDTLLKDGSLSNLNRDEDKPYKDSLNTMLDDTNAYIDKGYMNKSMRSEVSDDPAYQIRHIYAPLTSKIVTDQLKQRGTIPYIVDAEETLGLHQDFFGFSIAMFNIKGKNVSETQESESESETNSETPTSESEKQTESEAKEGSEEFVAKTKKDWLSTAEKVKKLFAEKAREKNKGYSNSHDKKSFLKFTFKKKGYKNKKISARRDCSGYVNAALYAAGILPKSALKNGGKLSTKLNLAKYGFEKIEVKSSTKLEKGDILVREKPGHIEIYAGDGKVWSAGNTNQVKNTGKNSKMHTDYLWRKTWEKADDDKEDPDEDGEDPNESTPAPETPSTEAPSTRTFYSQLLESAKDPEGFATYCEDEGYSEPEDANGDPDKEGLHPNELEYSGLATYGIYSESVFYYFSWLLYDYGLNPESSEVDHFKDLILKDTSNGSIDFFYNNTGEYGNGELKDFMDMRGLFTYVIPYLKRLNDIVVEWDDYYGLKYYKGIATGENLFSQYTVDKSQKYWNNLNTARLYNIYTPWVDLMYDCSYAKSEDIKFLGKTYTIKDPLDPNSYPAAEGRPMIFSQSEMSGMGLTKKDLTAVEKLILKCNEGMQGRMFEILNYANFNDVTLNTIAAMECAFQFNKTFSEENFIRKSGNNIIYPQGFELSDFSYDAYLRYVLSESTGESLVGLKDKETDTDDFYFRVMKKSSLITGLMYLIVDIVSMYLLPWSKIIFIVLTLLAGMFVILVSLFRLDKQHNFLKKFWDAFLLPIIGFTVVTMAMGLVLSLFMGMANNVITQTNTATIRFGDPVTAMAAILVVELAVFYCYTRFISKQFATVKSNGSVLVNTLTGVVGGIGVAVSGAFKNLTNGNSSKGKVTASESSTSGTSSANERAINRSKIQVEDKDDRSRRRRSRAEERAERHKEDLARRNNNLNQGVETKEEYNKRKEEERQKTEELNRKTEQGANHVQGTESNQN